MKSLANAELAPQIPEKLLTKSGAPVQSGAQFSRVLWLPSPDERDLLAFIVNDFGAQSETLPTLEPRAFTNDAARRIFGACRAVWSDANTYATLTPLSLADYCAERARQCEADADATANGEECQRLIQESALWGEAREIVEVELATLPTGAPDATKEAKGIAKRLSAAPSFEFLSLDDLEALPRPKWLIQGILIEQTTSVVSADSGSFKSFLALELALCLATGTPFHGREVKRGPVVYVAAEGFHTLRDRATAWLQWHGLERPKNFHILRAPVNVSDEKTVAAFVSSLATLRPVFLVLDTLSQCALGLNENSNDEMARFVAGMMRLGTASGAHVCAVHHNAKAGGFRGASAIHANVDARVSLERPENDTSNTVFVRCEKQRGAPFAPFALRGEEVVLPYSDEYGDPVTSLVFQLAGAGEVPTSQHSNAKRGAKTRERLLELFDELEGQFNGAGVRAGTWKARAEEEGICTGSTFWRHRDELAPESGTGPIIKDGDVYRRKGVTPTTPITPNSPNGSCESAGTKAPENYSHNSHNPLGMGVVGVVGGSAGIGSKARSKNGHAAIDSEPYASARNGS